MQRPVKVIMETFGPGVLESETPVLEAFVAEARVSVEETGVSI